MNRRLSSYSQRRHESGGGISVVDLTSFGLLTILAPETTWEALALTSDGRYLYALDSENAELRVFDTTTLEEVARVAGLGTYPAAVFLILVLQ